ncbi:MAG: Do family serine endopeptidase [Nibricoccus sp.]
MKIPFITGLVALAVLVQSGLFAAATKKTPATAKESPPTQKPALSIDSSPIDEGKAPNVTSYANVIEPVQKAVVSVYSTKFIHERIQVDPLFRRFFGDQIPGRESKEQGIGSGAIVSANGFVLTNNHVVEGADELSVSLPDGREFKGRIVGTDPKTDVAVVKIEADNLPTLTLADSDKLRVGDVVFAVGNPLGIGQTVTMGIVSAKGRNSLGLIENGYENFIQTDAAINMGNSGGALVDAKGRLVGINSAIVSTSRGNIGIGLAIPVNLAATVMNSLVETGTVTRGYLGISVDPVTPERAKKLGLHLESKAVVVTTVVNGSPAEKAGLKRDDLVLSINETPITSVQDLRLFVAQIPPDSEIAIKILREGKELVLRAKLGRQVDNASNELLDGVEISPLNDELRGRLNLSNQIDGLVITKVDRNSIYADQLVPGMVILEINRKPIRDAENARKLLQTGRNLLLIYHRGYLRYLMVAKDTR